MKYYSLLTLCLILVLSACVVDYKKLKDSNVDLNKVQLAGDFANNFLIKQRNGDLYESGSEVTEEMKDILKPENQKTGYEELKKRVGDYVTLTYGETWVHSTNPSTYIVRFKGTFQSQTDDIEIRVIVNAANAISGFRILPWKDKLE